MSAGIKSAATSAQIRPAAMERPRRRRGDTYGALPARLAAHDPGTRESGLNFHCDLDATSSSESRMSNAPLMGVSGTPTSRGAPSLTTWSGFLHATAS